MSGKESEVFYFLCGVGLEKGVCVDEISVFMGKDKEIIGVEDIMF